MDKFNLVDRQNILNNNYAIVEIQKATGINGLLFENQYRLLIEQVASFFEVDIRTIRRYLDKHSEELKNNGYEILKDVRLKKFKEQFSDNAGIKSKAPQVGIFNFKSFLNLSMLLGDSERAKIFRSTILDIAMDTINIRTGGNTKYINQREENFVAQYFKGEFYKKELSRALENFVNLGVIKYPIYLDKIYHSIFEEKADEYRKLLQLTGNDNERQTMYTEVLLLISSFEYGLAVEIEKSANRLDRKLEYYEVDKILKELIASPLLKPLIESAKIKMASRDYGFRKILHQNIKDYIQPIPIDDFEKFVGEKSKSLEEWLEIKDEVFKRLKTRT